MGTNPLIDGGPARPVPAYGGLPPSPGMTLRDHFAGEAFKAIASGTAVSQYTPAGFALMATQAFQAADALLTAREVPSAP